jgi:hypothetical protein
MDEPPKTRWRFSLRTLLAMAIPIAVCGVAHHYLGAAGLIGTLFAIVSIAAATLLTGPHRRAYLTSYFAVYGPFFAMALYTLAFVECSHCKLAAVSMLPYGPGLVPLLFVGQVVGMPMVDESLSIALGLAVCAGVVAGVAWLVHGRRRWVQNAIAGAALALSGFSAYVLLALIRA